MDIGGSHAVAGVVDLDRGCVVDGSRTRVAVDAAAETDTILGAWFGAARRALESAGGPAIVGAGIAMPGPFDYEQGICLIRGLAKLESLYGVNVRAEMKARVPAVAAAPVIFRNDAVCFLLGEAGFGAARRMGDAIGITLGTGLGSAFVRDGAVVEGGDDLPPGGWFYDQPFRGATAEQYFSSRGLLARHRDSGGASVPGVRELAQLASTEPQAAAALEDFGASLAEFLDPWIARFRPRCLVVGGNVARAWDRFAPPLCGALGRRWPDLAVRQSALFEDAALLGAARLPLLCREPQPS
jgi:glucokinase